MTRIVECVPNFSEGRRRQVVDELMLTFAGDPEAVVEAAVRAARRAAELIDLNHHAGEHPRMGATDVVPFVPVEDLSLEDCAALARRAGQRIGEELGIPVFLYEAAAT